METCVRGFSFMPETKVEVKNLQYIEGDELQRTWKASRRERVKQQEQRIWEKFVKEQDVVETVCKDDPYQFLEQLPDACLKELLDVELKKMREEKDEEEANIMEPDIQPKGDDDSPSQENTNQHVFMFVNEAEKEDSDVFHIFDDKDDESGPEDEALNDSLGSPNTVREQQNDDLSPKSKSPTPDKVSSKSSENVTNMIESTIYFAKVKDLRIKLTEELLSIIETVEQQNILNLEPEVLTKMSRRATEFCSRFNRIYLYQLQRQIQDIKRNNTVALPFAKHTQFQSQMVRIVSLHQNILQAFQVAHKSLQQTGCAGVLVEPGNGTGTTPGGLGALLRLAREVPLPGPDPTPAAANLYYDDVIPTCVKLEMLLSEYAAKMSDHMRSTGNTNSSHFQKSRKSISKKKSRGTWSKVGSKSITEADARLSMYSLESLRINLKPKASGSKDNQSSGTSKMRGSLTSSTRKPPETQPPAKGHKKSPRSRRPLMRDPHSGHAKRKLSRDTDIQTMVEAVGTCTSSHISREPSPNLSPVKGTSRRSKTITPRSAKIKDLTPRITANAPQNKLSAQSSKVKNIRNRPTTPNQQNFNTIGNGIRRDLQDTKNKSEVDTSPVSKINCSNKDIRQECKNIEETVKVNDSPRPSSRLDDEGRAQNTGRDKNKTPMVTPARCEVTTIVKQLCGGDATGNRNEKITGAKNAQLVCISGESPRQPSTPQLLRILEETIQKKAPKPLYQKPPSIKDAERFRLTFNIPEQTADKLFQYRTQFVQHMLTSPMYANSVVGKPWEVIGRVSEQIIDDLLLGCANEMELKEVIQRLYNQEIN
ncbi:uncharacterized protein LOC113519928 isoform X2 [Galleria mellonella]|uniref:Uncharacterized protein LOC113519928 isoform X2 n=1 Tax=Galleria mellonella TaxID=7137 RepID=A0ABM3N3Q6_GALME|nr:uncharacterized protein LOC113519928 isoform X2 [Galleria mellonella]